MLLTALFACENPISNAVFEADSDFAAALPGAVRLGLPARLRDLPEGGDELLLPEARAAAGEIEPLITSVVALGEVLRTTDPTERSPTHRLFAPRTLTAPAGSSVPTYWIRADLTRAAEDADIDWTVEAAVSADGPWTRLAWGQHAPDGLGELTWDAPVLSALVGDGGTYEALTVTYDEGASRDERTVELEFPPTLGPATFYAFVGDSGFGFSRPMDLTGEGPTPAGVTLVVLPDGAGRAEGARLQGLEEVPFTTCWDSAGVRVYGSGGAGFPASGDAGACAL